MTIYSFFRKWVNDKMYSLKLKKPPCHLSKEPLWTPQWTKPVKLDDPDCVFDPDWNYDVMYSELNGNIYYHYKTYDD
jgi:hypothetical protein